MIRKTILILGGGVSGWSLACLLRKQLPRDLVDIQLVEDHRTDNYVVEAARSQIHDFHRLIGLEEKTCIQTSQATFGLGTSCSLGAEINYFLSEGPYGAPLNGVDFQSIYFRSTTEGNSHNFADYSLSAVAGSLGRFGHPAPDPKSIYSTIQYGLHLELNSYADILKNHARQLGVESVIADCVAVNLDEHQEKIKSLQLNNGSVVTADLFIDCTGEASILLGGALGVGFVVDDVCRLFDRVALGHRLKNTDNQSISFLDVKDDSVLKIVPVKGKEIALYLYSSEFLDSNRLEEKMRALSLIDVEFQSIEFKRRENLWVKNCIAIGNAGINTYDLLVSPLTLVRNSGVRILDVLLDFGDMTASAREYNRLTLVEYEEFKTLIELQLYLTRESSHGLKKYFNSHALSTSAKHRLDLFTELGRHPHTHFPILTKDEWTAFFTGNGIFPKSFNRDAEAIDGKSLIEYTEKLRTSIYNAAKHMPAHENYIANVAITNKR